MKKKLPNTILHHVVYSFNGVGNHQQIDIKVPIFTTEHHILTELQRRGGNVSRGFLQSLRYFLWEKETIGNYITLVLPLEIESTIQKEGGKK